MGANQMIQTIRDAETHILRLEREIEYLKKQIRLTNGNGASGGDTYVTINNINELDAELSADGSTVFHKLKHVFRNAVNLGSDIAGSVFDTITAAILKLRNNNYPPDTFWRFLAGDSVHSGTNRSLIIDSPTTGVAMVIEETTATARNQIYFTSDKVAPFGNNFTDLGSSTEKWKNFYTTAADINNLNVISDVKVFDGVTFQTGQNASNTVLTGVSPNLVTINYKDWNGINQSITVMNNIIPSSAFMMFTKGIRTT